MENENKSDAQRPSPTVSRILPNGDIVELLYDRRKEATSLAVSFGDTVTVEQSIAFGGTKLIPWSAKNNLIKQEAVLLPERPESFGTVGKLITEIDEYLNRYIDLSDGFRRIAVYYILLTWVYDAFNEVPYLRL